MFISEITDQMRRDFWANYECEHCGHREIDKRGYDDTNFHINVVPNMKCKQCGKTANPDDYSPRATKYDDSVTI